jgi:hypothetical protein
MMVDVSINAGSRRGTCAREACRPEREAGPEAQGGWRVGEVRHGGGRHEKRGVAARRMPFRFPVRLIVVYLPRTS